MIIGLIIILLLVLFLPFTKIVERNLEVFLFIMGVLATIISGVIDWELIQEALKDPVNITLAVLIAGLLFRWFQTPVQHTVLAMSRVIPYRLFIALFVILLGLLSSIITAIVAAIILATIVSFLKLDRKSEIRLVVIACFAIGLGAALTPIGEPLSTIVTSKMNADFFYLLQLIGTSVIPGVVVFGILAAFMITPKDTEKKEGEPTVGRDSANNQEKQNSDKSEVESYPEIIIRSLKIFLFVMALTFLGAGFEPFIEKYVLGLSPLLMYWINTVSAVLDNATLAAAEVSPAMNEETVKDILMGLLFSGGILIPGNIPNIIAAGKLKITSIQWAKIGVPVGLIAMAIYFMIILMMG